MRRSPFGSSRVVTAGNRSGAGGASVGGFVRSIDAGELAADVGLVAEPVPPVAAEHAATNTSGADAMAARETRTPFDSGVIEPPPSPSTHACPPAPPST